jgi:hypothetical protein
LFVAEKPENLASLSPSMPSSIVQSEQTTRHRNTNCQPFVVIDEHVPQKETRSTTFSSNLIGERVVLDERVQELRNGLFKGKKQSFKALNRVGPTDQTRFLSILNLKKCFLTFEPKYFLFLSSS